MRSLAHAGLYGLLILISLFNFGSFKYRRNIHAQKKIDLLLWLLFFGFVVTLLQAGITANEWLVISIPLACFIAMILARSSQFVFLEVIHFLFLAGCLALQLWWIIDL
jgi:hypothetical protein